ADLTVPLLAGKKMTNVKLAAVGARRTIRGKHNRRALQVITIRFDQFSVDVGQVTGATERVLIVIIVSDLVLDQPAWAINISVGCAAASAGIITEQIPAIVDAIG